MSLFISLCNVDRWQFSDVHHAKAVLLIKRKYRDLRPELDERGGRRWAATEARALSHGGVAAVARATGAIAS